MAVEMELSVRQIHSNAIDASTSVKKSASILFISDSE